MAFLKRDDHGHSGLESIRRFLFGMITLLAFLAFFVSLWLVLEHPATGATVSLIVSAVLLLLSVLRLLF